MKSILFLFVLFAVVNNFSQDRSIIKQITNVDGDARNAFISSQFYNGYVNGLFFEVHKDSVSNIYRMGYDWRTDDLINPTAITNDSCMDINSIVVNNFLFFQTNKKGNWDIAYKIFEDTAWSETKYAANSLDDETNLKFISKSPTFWFDDSIRISFNKNDTTFLLTYRDSSFMAEPVFENSDSIIYSQIYITYFVDYNYDGSIIATARKIAKNNSSLIYKIRDNNSIWSNEITIKSDTNASNPKFLSLDYFSYFVYENKDSVYNNIYFIQDWSSQPYIYKLKDTLIGDLSDFNSAAVCPIITISDFQKRSDFYFNVPFTYKYFIHDSMFINVNKYLHPHFYYGPDPDTLIYTNVKNTSLTIGFVSSCDPNFVVWEDSINGRIQLFADKFYSDYSDVNDLKLPTEFTLYQNYPNPFNPTTTIRFYNPHSSYLKLKVYNVLGEEIKRLVDGYTESGIHEIKFNGGNLSSGIYFYQIEGNNFKQVKKMILLK